MKKIFVLDYAEAADEQGATEIMYVAREADARIEQLERALKSCAHVIADHIKQQRSFLPLAIEALAEADKALPGGP